MTNPIPDCPRCAGEGKIRHDGTCAECDGSGQETADIECGHCDGSGATWEECPDCAGTGTQSLFWPLEERNVPDMRERERYEDSIMVLPSPSLADFTHWPFPDPLPEDPPHAD